MCFVGGFYNCNSGGDILWVEWIVLIFGGRFFRFWVEYVILGVELNGGNCYGFIFSKVVGGDRCYGFDRLWDLCCGFFDWDKEDIMEIFWDLEGGEKRRSFGNGSWKSGDWGWLCIFEDIIWMLVFDLVLSRYFDMLEWKISELIILLLYFILVIIIIRL